MKFEIETNTIKDYLKRLTHSVQSISSRVEFTGVLITIENQKIYLEGRSDYLDTKIQIFDTSLMKIIEEGQVLIKASMLNEIIQRMSGPKITFTKIEENLVVVESEDANYKINLLSNEKYERSTFLKQFDSELTIEARKFKNTINKVRFAGDEQNKKFIFQGLNLIINNNKMKVITCDGIRIATNESNINSDGELNKIIPLKVVKEMMNILPESGEYRFGFINNKAIVMAKNILLQFSLIEGTFPSFDKFFEKDSYSKTLTINREELLSKIERTTILSTNRSDISNRISLMINSDKFILESREQEIGEAKIEFKNFEYSGDELKISLSPKIIFEGVRATTSDMITIYFSDSRSSVFLKGNDDQLLYLMSPMI